MYPDSPICPSHSVTLFPRLGLALIAAIAGFRISSMTAGEAAPAGRPPESTFVVFFGLDVSVEAWGRKFPVIAATDRHVSIVRDGSRLNIPTDDATLKTSLEPKLGQHQVTIERLTGESLFDSQTDPNREALQQQLILDSVQSDQRDIAAAAASGAAVQAEAITRMAADPLSGVTQREVQSANTNAANADAAMTRAFTSPMFGSALPGQGETDDKSGHDAFRVSFRLSAATAVENAYGLLQLIIRSPETNGQSFLVLRFFPLRSVSPEARKVTVMQTGLPRGFTVDSYAVHVYTGGQELPSNLSSNRMDLNADEAHQFLLLRHLQINPSATMPAQIISELVPLEVRTWAASASDNRTVELAIDRRGRVTAVRLAAEAGSAAEAAQKEQWLRVPFLPALVNGVPADSEGTFATSELGRE